MYYFHFHYSTRFATTCAGVMRHSQTVREIKSQMRDECCIGVLHDKQFGHSASQGLYYIIYSFGMSRCVSKGITSIEGEAEEPAYVEEGNNVKKDCLVKENRFEWNSKYMRIWTWVSKNRQRILFGTFKTSIQSTFSLWTVPCRLYTDMLRSGQQWSITWTRFVWRKKIIYMSKFVSQTIDDLDFHFARLDRRVVFNIY